MKMGDIVTIFKDPGTNKDIEGLAELLARVAKDDDGLECWRVMFLDDQFITERFV